jgi:hypothetical protein
MVSLALASGGYVSIDPNQVASIREVERPGIIDDGKTEITLRNGQVYLLYYGERTVRNKLGL